MHRWVKKFLYKSVKILFEYPLYHVEHKVLMRSNKRLKYPPIFIIGPPRSGTTFLYQLMTHHFHLAYFPNVANYFEKIPLLVTKFALKLAKPYSSDFTSNYGKIEGVIAPSEGGAIWNRWYPTEDRDGYNYTPTGFFSEKTKHLIYQTVAAIEALFDAPFINKNVKHSVRIRSLAEIFPEALFLWMKRDPFDTAISILRARKEMMGKNANNWWSVMPKEIEQLRDKNYLEQVAGQVYFIERIISRDIAIVGKERLFKVYYSDLCANPQRTLDEIAAFIREHGGKLRVKYSIPSHFNETKHRGDTLNEEERRLQKILSKYYSGEKESS